MVGLLASNLERMDTRVGLLSIGVGIIFKVQSYKDKR
jgi:hypothetical protein